MSGLKVGSAAATKVYVGTTPAQNVYLGATQIWSAGPAQLTGVTYTQSSVWHQDNPVDYTYMNNHNADGSINNAETACDTNVDLAIPPYSWIRADCGSTKNIDHIVIGYDYKTNLPGGFGPPYTSNRSVKGSLDATTWTSITTTPNWDATLAANHPNGLVPVPINGNWRYIQLGAGYDEWLCLLEFEIWGN
jgi:hypothetical protein